MSSYNLNVTHPLIENKQHYSYYKKTVSIHSEDRDILKYPISSQFEITLPQDYLNVQSVKLSSWTFPYNMNTFSYIYNNITFTFKINNPYNPGEFNAYNPLQTAIFDGLYSFNNDGNIFEFQIQSGNYTHSQMVNELQNKMNYVVTTYLTEYIKNNYPTLLNEFISNGGYKKFILVYNSVSDKIWYGNISDGFEIINTTTDTSQIQNNTCNPFNKLTVPSFDNIGLLGYLGFTKCNIESIKASNPDETRFYYGFAKTPGDDGFWLSANPGLKGSSAYFIEPPFKTVLEQPYSFYLDIQLLNCLDEIAPYNISTFTLHNSINNGIVNSAFAKISPQTYTDNNISNFFDYNAVPFKYFDPPAERIRKLFIKIRYHDGTLVDFSNLPFTFTLDFGLMNPSSLKEYKFFTPNANSI